MSLQMERDVLDARSIGGQESHEDSQAGKGRRQANDAGSHAKYDALNQDLLDETNTGGAQRAANGDLALASRGAGQHEVRNVGAGDEQNKANSAEEQ